MPPTTATKPQLTPDSLPEENRNATIRRDSANLLSRDRQLRQETASNPLFCRRLSLQVLSVTNLPADTRQIGLSGQPVSPAR